MNNYNTVRGKVGYMHINYPREVGGVEKGFGTLEMSTSTFSQPDPATLQPDPDVGPAVDFKCIIQGEDYQGSCRPHTDLSPYTT